MVGEGWWEVAEEEGILGDEGVWKRSERDGGDEEKGDDEEEVCECEGRARCRLDVTARVTACRGERTGRLG